MAAAAAAGDADDELPEQLRATTTALTGIEMSGVTLVRAPASLAQYGALSALNLSRNLLESLPYALFESVPSLTLLDVSANRLRALPASIGNLHRLDRLYLEDNEELTALPEELGKCSVLQELRCSGCPIENIPPQVLSGSATTVVFYLRDQLPRPETPVPRKWLTGERPPDSAFTFRLVSYNILAESYATSQMFPYTPQWALAWSYRRQRILQDIIESDADVVCLQEVEAAVFDQFLLPQLQKVGYLGIFKAKSRQRKMDRYDGMRVDGCATFWRTAKFRLRRQSEIEYSSVFTKRAHDFGHDQGMLQRLILKDNVVLFVALEPLDGRPLPRPRNIVVLANAHIHWNPHFSDVKLMQTQLMLEHCDHMTHLIKGELGATNVPLVVVGDFNSTPDSGVYQLMTSGHVSGNHPDFLGNQFGVYTQRGLRHGFQMASAYAAVASEPAFTNYTLDFVGVLDYIFFSQPTIAAVAVLDGIDYETARERVALPNANFPSDHILLAAELTLRL